MRRSDPVNINNMTLWACPGLLRQKSGLAKTIDGPTPFSVKDSVYKVRQGGGCEQPPWRVCLVVQKALQLTGKIGRVVIANNGFFDGVVGIENHDSG